jgi:hypothetical protein
LEAEWSSLLSCAACLTYKHRHSKDLPLSLRNKVSGIEMLRSYVLI